MEQKSNPVSSTAALCRSGCGFYGNSATNGLCSKCFKNCLERVQSSSAGPASPVSLPTTAGPASPVSLPTTGTEDMPSRMLLDKPVFEQGICETAIPTVQPASPSEVGIEKVQYISEFPEPGGGAACAATDSGEKYREQNIKNRCNACRKKLGLTGFHCRCGGFFCSVHRYTDEHNCTFDYKSLGAQEIKKNNPVVVAEKVKKI